MVAILNLQNKNRNLEVLIWQYLKQKIYERYTEYMRKGGLLYERRINIKSRLVVAKAL